MGSPRWDGPFDDRPVHVSQTQDSPVVYHSQSGCPRMPAAYDTMRESLAVEGGLRECSVCLDSRLSFLEL